jgi:hypothetical protein
MSYVVVARCVAQDEHKDKSRPSCGSSYPQCRCEPGHRDFVTQKSVERPSEFLLQIGAPPKSSEGCAAS